MSEKHGGPNGFLLGLIIGGAVGALISTKRGRQILKDIADYGLEYVGNTINMEDIESILDEDSEEMYADELDLTKAEKEEARREVKEAMGEKGSSHQTDSRRRRLFRGIRKK